MSVPVYVVRIAVYHPLGLSLLRTVIGLNGSRPVALHPLQIFCIVNVLQRARIYISVHSTLDIRPESSLETLSVSRARARFSGANTPTSSGWSSCEQ